MRKTLSSTIAGVCFTLLLSFVAMASPTPPGESLPLLPEATDPVLGHRAAVIEWAWSPQYAERFGLPVQEGGLENGYLWLVGVKVVRMDFFDRPTYRCRIVGLLQNDAPIVWPPGEHYVMHPSQLPMGGGLPGQGQYRGDIGPKPFTPGHGSWVRRPKSDSQRLYPESGITSPYYVMHRSYSENLAYFELDGSCRHFGDPKSLETRIHLPTRRGDGEEPSSRAFKPDAIYFVVPDRVMTKIYPYVLSASDWTNCLMHRSGLPNLPKMLAQERQRLGEVNCTKAEQ